MFSHLVFALPTPILLLILSHPNLSTADYQTCYNPDGSANTDGLIPCNSTLPNSACCGFLDSCTATGICLGSAGLPYRGGCTDPTWSSTICSTWCMTGTPHPPCNAFQTALPTPNLSISKAQVRKVDANPDVQSNRKYTAPSNIYHCGTVGVFDGDVCCQTMSGDSCCDLNATFDYKNSGVSFTPSLDLRIEQAKSESIASASASATSTIYVTVTTTASSSSAASTNANSAAAESGSIAASSSSNNSDLPLALGASIGIPLGICSVGVLSFCFWREGRRTAGARGEKKKGSSSQWGGSMSSEERAYLEQKIWRDWIHGGANNEGSAPQFEMAGVKSPMELPHRQSARELDGNGRR
ncbi:hypothetical protein B7494_g1319 [Chlorociboria aeruginascens]|nr:hypothetical protein B7494_g1319 [Chlorociboria aeruginascens]